MWWIFRYLRSRLPHNELPESWQHREEVIATTAPLLDGPFCCRIILTSTELELEDYTASVKGYPWLHTLPPTSSTTVVVS